MMKAPGSWSFRSAMAGRGGGEERKQGGDGAGAPEASSCLSNLILSWGAGDALKREGQHSGVFLH